MGQFKNQIRNRTFYLTISVEGMVSVTPFIKNEMHCSNFRQTINIAPMYGTCTSVLFTRHVLYIEWCWKADSVIMCSCFIHGCAVKCYLFYIQLYVTFLACCAYRRVGNLCLSIKSCLNQLSLIKWLIVLFFNVKLKHYIARQTQYVKLCLDLL